MHHGRPLRLLIAEDNEFDAALIVHELRNAGYDPHWERVDSEAAYVAKLSADLDIIVSDYNMPQFNGLRALQLLKESGLETPFILVSGVICEEAAVAAIKQGAADYLLKDRLKRLGAAVQQAIAQMQLRRQHRVGQQAIDASLARLHEAQRIGQIGDWDYNSATKTITWSPQMFPMLGRDPQLGPPGNFEEVAAIYDVASRAIILEHQDRAIKSGRLEEFDLRGRRADGEQFYVHATTVPRINSDGRVLGLYGTVQDVTESTRASALLVENRRRLSLATESAHIGIWDLNVLTNKLLWDSRMYKLYGIREQDFSGAYDAWTNGLQRTDRKRAEAELTAALNGEKDFHTEFRIVWPNGEERYMEAHALVQRANDGSAISMIGVNWDITERKHADTSIRRLNRVYAVLSGINSLIVRARDRDALLNEACRIAVELGGFKMAWVGVIDPGAETIVAVASAYAEPEFREFIGDHLLSREGTPVSGATQTARAVREKRTLVINEIGGDTTVVLNKQRIERGILSMVILPLRFSGDVVGVLELYADEIEFFDHEEIKLLEELAGDIGFAMDHIEKQKRLDYLAYFDVLTGLANRNLFQEQLAQSIRGAAVQGTKLVLLIMDLQRFKNINDSLGRAAGDSLLKQVAQWLKARVPNAGVLARVGADQFAVVVPATIPEADGAALFSSAVDAFKEHPFHLNDAAFRIGAKAGLALYPEDGATAETLFRNAEAALKNAKTSGNRYRRYTKQMTEAMAGKLGLENQLRDALAKEEFVLHYQPKVSLMTGKLTGAEALIRWNHPQRGLVPPGQFIPLLEETGLIFEVGRWALRKAIEDYLQWSAAGLCAVRVAVNVSPLQLRQRDFIAEIQKVILIDARAAGGLELELTESLIMEDVKHSVASLQAIRAMGVRVAIDDFGTGFSSLSYLAKLPVDSLKIDRAFVVDMTCGPQGLALVSTIIDLARSLRLKVVAEGVETDEQSRLLHLLNCDEIQGFFISKAVPRDTFASNYLAPVPVGTAELGKEIETLLDNRRASKTPLANGT